VCIITLLTEHYSGEQIDKSEMGATCSTYGGEQWAYGGLVRKSEGKRPLGRARSIWEDNIKMDLEKLEWGLGLY
jgi:hypothetical protein